MKRLWPLLEASLVVGLFYVLRLGLKDTGFSAWQQDLFGAARASSVLLFFALPIAVVLATRRDPGAAGLTSGSLRYHFRTGLRAVSVVILATALFPVIAALGTDHRQWLGAAILSVGFSLAGVLMVWRIRRIENFAQSSLSLSGLLAYAGLLLGGLILLSVLNPVAPLLARLVSAILFVGFLEEFFFRGYLQARLNDSFGKPLSLCGVEFGAGLFIAALVFGLMHPLTATGAPLPWAWALWTATGGLLFGYVREKTGAVVAPAVVHGIILVPGVLFAPEV